MDLTRTLTLTAVLVAAALALPTASIAESLPGSGGPGSITAPASTHDSWVTSRSARALLSQRTFSVAAAGAATHVSRPVPARGQLAPDVFALALNGRLFIVDDNPVADAVFGGVPCGVDASRGCVYGRAASVLNHTR